MKNSKIQKRILALLSIMSLCIWHIIPCYASSIDLGLNKVPKVDVMFAIDNRAVENVNVDNIDTDLDSELLGGGQDTNDFEYVSKESSEFNSTQLDFSDIVNSWQKIGKHVWSSNGSNIYCNISNSSLSNYGSALINPGGYDTNEFTASFTLDTNGTMHNGFLFNVTKNANGTLNGYMFSITAHSHLEQALWKISNFNFNAGFGIGGIFEYIWCGSQTSGGTRIDSIHYWKPGATATKGGQSFTCLANWPYIEGDNLKYNVDYFNGRIRIKCNDTILCDIKDETYKYGTYGFYGINCEQTASMKLSHFNMKNEKPKDFSNILNNNKWRDNSLKCVVNINNKEDESLKSAGVISKTLNENINFMQYAGKDNLVFSKDFINTIENQGQITYYRKEDTIGP